MYDASTKKKGELPDIGPKPFEGSVSLYGRLSPKLSCPVVQVTLWGAVRRKSGATYTSLSRPI